MKQKKVIQSNQLSSKQFKALIENAHEGIVLYDLQGKIKYIAPAVVKITGYRESEVLGKTGESFLHPSDIKETKNAIASVLEEQGKSFTLFQRIRHKKGHFLLAESRLTNLLHVPEINGVVSNFRDITEKKFTEEKAKKTQELLETINRNLSEGIFMGVLGREFIYVNEAFLRITGYKSFQEVSKIKPEAIFADKPFQQKLVKKLKASLTLTGIETLFKRKNGTQFWGVIDVRLLKHEGKDDYFVGTLRDVSREKEAERQLIESRNFFNNIINTVAAPIFVKDEKHKWILCNDSFCTLVGKSREQIIGKSDHDFFSREEAKQFWKTDNETLRTGKTIAEEERLTKKGEVHHLLTVKSRYINEKDQKYVIGFITEVTHLKNAEAEIKHLHENLEGVLESSDESIFSVDTNFRYTAFNKRHKNIMKLLYNADIAIGKDKLKLFKNHSDKTWVKSELQKALEGHHFVSDHYQDFPRYKGYIQTTYNPIRSENGDVKGIAVFVQDITQRKKYEQIINSINAKLRGVMESTSDGIFAIDRNFNITLYNNSFVKGFKNIFGVDVAAGDNVVEVLPPEIKKMMRINIEKAFEGNRISSEVSFPAEQILETAFNPIYDNASEVTGAALFIRNITDRKRMEEHNRILNRELVEQNVQLANQEAELKAALKELSERNFELDQLMYKTSHDLRSPLSSIIGLINLANIDDNPSAYKEYLSKIEGRAKKLDEFIRSMLDYARVNRLELDVEAIDLKAMIHSCIGELEYIENSDKMRSEISIDEHCTPFRSDKLRLTIIFSNIISNAYKYLNPEADSYLRINITADQSWIKIIFQDNGIGIKEEYQSKIFNMFYRATDRSQGSGLGMYIVKQAVEKIGGNISLSSDYGKGTRIEIVLPRNLDRS